MARLGVELRAGVHTGEVKTIAGKPGGLVVNIGARIGALVGPSALLVSLTVKGLTAQLAHLCGNGQLTMVVRTSRPAESIIQR